MSARHRGRQAPPRDEAALAALSCFGGEHD